MTRPARSLVVLALIAWHGLAIALGPCAHAVAGSNHQAARPVDGDHRRDPADRGDSLGSVDDSADCPICQFVAQGQLGTAPLGLTPGLAVATLDDPTAPPRPHLTPPRPSLPRAPPPPRLSRARSAGIMLDPGPSGPPDRGGRRRSRA